jgi:hypothetical protein
VEGAGHDPISQVKSFLNAITMMNVNVYVQHSWMVFQQLQDRHHNVIDITEATGLKLLSMMQAPRPVYGNVRLLSHYFLSSL